VRAHITMNHLDLLRRVSRTFALSIEGLPPAVREPLSVAYLLFRVSDTVEDDAVLDAPRKADLLRTWADVLDHAAPVGPFAGTAGLLDPSAEDVEVVRRAGEVMDRLHSLPAEVQSIVVSHARATALGMARWQDHGPEVVDEDELDDYMFEVAGRVGYLITDVFAWYSPAIRARVDRLRPLARESGLALQTVNVIRGLRTDYERGWVFVPRTFYEPCGLSRDGLFDARNLEVAMGVVHRLADKAERHLDRGCAFITGLPRHEHRIRLACIWPLFFAARTLAVCRDNPAVLRSEAKIGRSEVRRIVRDTTLLGWSNHWLALYYRRLASPPV
jgi:farnesyl-diphosphate farnesyltransferase